MARKVYIVETIIASTFADAVAAGCVEVCEGIPPALADELQGQSLPYVYTEPGEGDTTILAINVGIPVTKTLASGKLSHSIALGQIEFNASANTITAIVMESPNGSKWRLGIDDTGTVIIESV